MEREIGIPSLTLAELVTAVAGSVSEIRRDLVERRLAHWIVREVLKPIGDLNTGSGRHRRFEPEEAYISAVLLRLPLRSIAEITAIATVLRTELPRGGELTKLWTAAKDHNEGQKGRTVFAAFNVRLDAAAERPVAVEIQPKLGNGLESPRFYIQGLSAIVVNLTDAFGGVKLPP